MKNTEPRFILSLDQGTTSSRAIVFNQKGKAVSFSQKEITQYYPQPGWVEHDPIEIWNTQLFVAQQAILLAKIVPEQILSIGITNQRETFVLWDKKTGKPIHNAIVWQCRRSDEICNELRISGLESKFQHKTGLRLDPYFSGTKITWLFRNIPELLQKAKNEEILFGTIDSWLLWNLTGAHLTDITNASRTLLFNIIDEKWDSELSDMLQIPMEILPKVLSSSDDFGFTKPQFFGKAIPINGVAGDQQAALFGHACFYQGMAKNTYGTGCFALLNTGNTPIWSKNNLLTTIAWKINGETTFALEGSVFIGGAVIQWLRDELQLIKCADDSETLAKSVPNSNGVLVIPAFVGLGAPYWDTAARGSILGITRGVSTAHIIHAALESIAFQSEDLLNAMAADFKQHIVSLKADGGASKNSFLMQYQANISNVPVSVAEINEITCLGAAYLAGLYCGYWNSFEEIQQNWHEKSRFEPTMNDDERKKLLDRWHRAVSATREFRL